MWLDSCWGLTCRVHSVQLLGLTLGVTLGAEGDIHGLCVCGQSIACDPATFLTAPAEEFLEEGCSKRRCTNMSAESQRAMMTSLTLRCMWLIGERRKVLGIHGVRFSVLCSLANVCCRQLQSVADGISQYLETSGLQFMSVGVP